MRALGNPGDILLTFTTSASHNVLNAIAAAHDKNMRIILVTGRDGGAAAPALVAEDIMLCVPSASTARIQESHLVVIHCLCDLVDQQLLGPEA